MPHHQLWDYGEHQEQVVQKSNRRNTMDINTTLRHTLPLAFWRFMNHRIFSVNRKQIWVPNMFPCLCDSSLRVKGQCLEWSLTLIPFSRYHVLIIIVIWNSRNRIKVK
jgi:hypothetical protein